MTAKTIEGTIENAYGKPLSEYGKDKLTYSGTLQVYESIDEVRAANDMPSNDEIVSIVNQRKVANARQKFIKAALEAAGIQAPTLEDKSEAIKAIVKALIAQGKSEDEAKQLATAMLA